MESQMSRPNLDLELVGVRAGDILIFHNDNEITCVVVETHRPKVYFQGEVMSLSGAAQRVTGLSAAQGAAYWTFEGELLKDRRQRFEHYHVTPFNLVFDKN